MHPSEGVHLSAMVLDEAHGRATGLWRGCVERVPSACGSDLGGYLGFAPDESSAGLQPAFCVNGPGVYETREAFVTPEHDHPGG